MMSKKGGSSYKGKRHQVDIDIQNPPIIRIQEDKPKQLECPQEIQEVY